MPNTTWTFHQGLPGAIFRENYSAVIKKNGYQVRQFAEDIGRGDNFYASSRCETIGDPKGYPTYGQAILACLERAGIAKMAGRHFVERGPGQIHDVKFVEEKS